MKKYYITTDSGASEITATSLRSALAEWGEAPATVHTAASFERWLRRVGGYGWIEEDGVRIAEVRA